MRSLLILVLSLLAFGQDRAKTLALEMQRLTAEGNILAARQLVPTAEQQIEKLGLANPNSAMLVNQIAILQQMLGQYAEAEQTYARAIQKLEKQDPSGLSLTILLLNLARTYLETNDQPGHAEVLARRALELAKAHFGADSPQLGMFLITLGSARQQQGHRQEAQRLYEQAFGGGPGNSELDKYQMALVFQNLGLLEALDHKWQVAKQHLSDAIALQSEANGPNHPNLIRPYLSLAEMHIMRKEWTAASECVAKARAIAEAQLSPSHPIMAEILARAAEIARKSGHRTEARRLERQAQAFLPDSRPSRSRVHVSDLVQSR